jgi:competence protein ComEC
MKKRQTIFASMLGLVILGIFQFFLLTPFDESIRIYFLDVGQGDAALIKYPTGESLLIDTGKDSQIFRELDKVLPWYNKTIDTVLLTHGDLDHVGSMLDIFERYQIKKIFISEFFGQIDIEKQINDRAQLEPAQIHILKPGDTLTFGSSVQNQFTILHPDSNCMNEFNNENDCSLVGLLTYGEQDFLFTGDISKEVEQKISHLIPENLELLKVAHHGSRFSTDQEFIQKIKPQYSIISVGENSYGHPHPDVLSVLEAASSTVLSTKEVATIVATSDGKSLKVEQLFDQARFFQSSICTILLYGFDTPC